MSRPIPQNRYPRPRLRGLQFSQLLSSNEQWNPQPDGISSCGGGFQAICEIASKWIKTVYAYSHPTRVGSPECLLLQLQLTTGFVKLIKQLFCRLGWKCGTYLCSSCQWVETTHSRSTVITVSVITVSIPTICDPDAYHVAWAGLVATKFLNNNSYITLQRFLCG